MPAVQTVRALVSLQPDSAHRNQFALLGNSEALKTDNSLDDSLSRLHGMVSHHHVANLYILVGDISAESEQFRCVENISTPYRPN